MHRTAVSLAVVSVALTLAALPAQAQRLSVGAGVLLSDHPGQLSYDFHVDSPPLYKTRAELTVSWNDESSKPTVITEAERLIIDSRHFALGRGSACSTASGTGGGRSG